MENIIKTIENLPVGNQIQIFNIIKKFNIKYTKNSNGILVDMNKIDGDCLKEINDYINFIKENKDYILDIEKEKEKIKNYSNNTI